MSPQYDFTCKRLAGIDYGTKRIGIAVCDEFHVTVNPRKVFDAQDPALIDDICEFLRTENVAAVVVGIPYRQDGKNESFIAEIEEFIALLNEKSGLPVIRHDEYLTSRQAVRIMVEIGRKKKDRRKKEITDMFAAALILRDFLKEYEGL